MSALRLPDGVLGMARRGPDWAAWVDGLTRLATDLVGEWDLTLDGLPMHGFCALVVPVRTRDRTRAVLKIGFPDDESEHEPLALQHWGGRGAVSLLRADPHRWALLLERLEDEDLTDLWDLEACEVVAGLYGRLHRPAPPQLRPLTSYVARWTDDLAALPRSAPLPRRMVEQAVSLGRSFVADEASNGVMIHTDLHYENVLRRSTGEPGEWVAIDPKPVSGDPHYEPAPMLWNRFAEVQGDVRGGLRRRFHALVDVGALDEDRARDWVVVRMLHNALWAIQDDPARTSGTETYLTTCVAIAKAVQD